MSQSVRRLWFDFVQLLPGLLIGLVVLVVLILLARLIAGGVRTLSLRAHLHTNLALVLSRLTYFIGTILAVLVAAVVVFPTFRPGDLVAGLGITSIALGFAFKDILQNFLAGILILWRQPFQVGDEIKFDSFEGTVDEINWRSTRIKTYDGERAIVPNSEIYTNTVLVRTAYNARRLRFVVGITYEASIRDAEDVIYRALERVNEVLKEPPVLVQVQEFGDFSVNLAVLYWVEPRTNTLATQDKVARAIKNALDEAGVEIPYPKSVVHYEGVPPPDAAQS